MSLIITNDTVTFLSNIQQNFQINLYQYSSLLQSVFKLHDSPKDRYIGTVMQISLKIQAKISPHALLRSIPGKVYKYDNYQIHKIFQ